MEKKYLIAVDAGGTKTEALLFTEAGEVLQRVRTVGINPFVSSFEQACADCIALLKQLTDAAPQPVEAVYAGIPALEYFGDRIPQALRAGVQAKRLRAETDGYMQISAMLGHADGAGLVCGTGSGLYVRSGGSQYMVGGWGYIVDGCASGFVLGRRAIRAAVREADGRGEKTLLTQLVNEQLGGDITQHLPEVYAGGRAYFASFARTVFAACEQGDPVATQIFNDCADDLAELVQTGWRRSGIRTLVLNGGIFQHFPAYVAALRARIPQEITVLDSDVPPIYGAAVEAMYDAGLPCSADFKENILKGLQ